MLVPLVLSGSLCPAGISSSAIGVVNLFTPTSGAIMGGLALAKIEWTTWLKFALKLIVALSVVCAIILTVACVML